MYRPVWVKLPAIFVHRSEAGPATIHANAVDTTSEVPGTLLQWLRTGSGGWLGLLDYELRFADGRQKTIAMQRQLVPAYALFRAPTAATGLEDPPRT